MSLWRNKWFRLVARFLVAAILFAWVFSQVEIGQFGRTVSAARWHYLLGVWLLTVLFSLLQSYALQIILRRQGCPVGLHRLFAATCVTALYSLVLPGILSTGVKWYILKRSTGKGTNVLSGMLYNQVTLAVVMTVLGLAGLIVTNPSQAILPEAHHWLPLACSVALVLILLLSVLALNERAGGPVIRLLLVLTRPLPSLMREKSREVLTQIATFQTSGWGFHATIAAINLVDCLFVSLLIYFCAARAVFVAVPVGVLLWLGSVVYVLGRIPISVANLGVREVTLVGLLGLYGIDKSAALLMSMVLFSSLVFLALVGMVYKLVWSVGADRPAANAAP
jgi:uncharacterized membrane protein YbhN (UPF0104 family)